VSLHGACRLGHAFEVVICFSIINLLLAINNIPMQKCGATFERWGNNLTGFAPLLLVE